MDNSKFVKISARPSSSLGSGIDWRTIASKVFDTKPLRDYISKKWPALSGGLYKNQFVEKFLESLEDPNFQAMAYALLQHMMGLGLLPQDLYKPEAFQQLMSTKGYGGQAIGAGAYQKTTGVIPPKEILPKLTVNNLEQRMQQIYNDPALITPAQKVKALSDFFNSVDNNISSFTKFVREKLPGAGV